MSQTVTILWVLLSTSAVLCLAILLVWLHFGRQRHVLSWAWAYGFAVISWGLRIAAALWLPENAFVFGAAGACSIMTSSLTAIGCRQRSLLPDRLEHFTLAIAAGMAAAFLAGVVGGGNIAMRAVIPCGYGAVMMAIAIHAIYRKPMRGKGSRGWAPAPVEITFMAVLAVIALFQICIAIAALLLVGPAGDPAGIATLRSVLGIAVPPLYIIAGIAVILLVAGDVAEQLRTLVTRDSLTGVLNRRGLEEAAMMAMANARRHKRKLAVAVADIDSFKQLNDRLGHSAGDKALIVFAEYIHAAIRHGDIFGRLGGDEFCLVLPDSSAADAAQVMERARREIARHAAFEVPECRLTASFGIAAMREDDLLFDTLVRRADRALYTSKLEGRNRVSIARGDGEHLSERWLVKGA